MRPTNCAFWLGSVAIAGLMGIASAAQPAPKSGTPPCLALSCPIQPVAEPPAKTETRAPEEPYDWKASFAAYQLAKCHGQLMASQTCRVYGAAPSSRQSSGRATNLTSWNMIPQSGPSLRMLRSKDSSTFALNPLILRRVKKLQMHTTRSGETVIGSKCR
jgi:hypothetical protein